METFTIFATNKTSSAIHREVIYADNMKEALDSARCVYPEKDFDIEFKATLFDASKWVRLLNYIIDLTIINVSMVFGFQQLASAFPAFARQLSVDPVSRFLVVCIVIFVYYCFLEGLFGVTIAKLITMTKVVTKNDAKLTLAQAALRTACRFLPFEQFTFLGDGTGWHDKYSKTKVVRRRKGPVPVPLKT